MPTAGLGRTELELSLCLVSHFSQVLLSEEGTRRLNPKPGLACGTSLNLCLFFQSMPSLIQVD